MKQLIVILFLITFFAGGQVLAQHGNMNAEKRKEIKEKQKQFIINKLQLTEKEKRDFIPVYEKYTSERENDKNLTDTDDEAAYEYFIDYTDDYEYTEIIAEL